MTDGGLTDKLSQIFQFDKEEMSFPRYQFIAIENNGLNLVDSSRFHINRNLFGFINTKACRSFLSVYETLNSMIRIDVQPRFGMDRMTGYGNRVCNNQNVYNIYNNNFTIIIVPRVIDVGSSSQRIDK